ncbi:pectate lyase-like adhesive domain-containing protein [Companilactobacillus sp. DQM5]|uniref:pectate lyase-like adhesive domain-containing protein n=1 Tax=Companilactobacillus sp. DQM5 TaxID=3463359 RepID=UPI004058AD16
MKKQLLIAFSIVLTFFIFFFVSAVYANSIEEVAGKENITEEKIEPKIEKNIEKIDSDNTKVNEKVAPEKIKSDKQAQTIATVDTYEKFVAAMNNKDVTEIEITADINGMGTSTTKIAAIGRDLSINANNHKLNIGSQYIPLTYNDLATSHTFKLSNANISNNKNGEGFVVVGTVAQGRWNLEFSGITAEKNSVNRVAQAHKCEVKMSGNNDISTAYENFELGSFILTKNSTYLGDNYGTDWAILDYTTASLITDTGFKRQFTMEDGATANFKTSYATSGQSGWPTVWGFYKVVNLGVNANLKVKWGHDIFRANGDTAASIGEYPLGLTINLKSGSVMDLDNVDDHDLPAINIDLGVNSINMEPGATLKAVSDGIYGALAFDGGTASTFYANQPKLVDLKNRRTNYKALTTTIGALTDFTIENTDVSYWSSDIDNDANPTGSFTGVKKISSKIVNKWSSEPPEVATALNAAKVQRFATKYVESGTLSISEFPTNISFGSNLTVPTKLTNYPIQSITGALKVTDTRANKGNWELSVSMLQDLKGKNTGYIMKDMLKYKSSLGDQTLNSAPIIVEKNKNTENDYTVSNNWGNNAGLYLQVPAGGVRADDYSTQIRWDIRDVPQ